VKLFRHIISVVLVSLIAHAGDQLTGGAKCVTNQPVAAELQALQGTWAGVMVGNESGGKIAITIAGNRFYFYRDANFWFDTTIMLPAGKDPKQLHATIKGAPRGQADSVGKVVGAIFKIEDATLTIVASGSLEEMPKSFEASETQNLSRYELRKAEPQKNTAPPKANERTRPKGWPWDVVPRI
jgi:uncharacterized protein (TIGR03067 family)